MEQVKTALVSLEQAILKLESAIYTSKKTQAQLSEQVSELKQVVKITHDRIDNVLSTCEKETE